MNILYITYDGILDPVSQSQVIPYLKGLSKKDNAITVLSFEKTARFNIEKDLNSRNEELKNAGISWMPRIYHKNPSIPATFFDILQGMVSGSQIIRKERIEVIHARGYIPMLIGLALKLIFRLKIIFDMRGFWPDEKVDAGAWKANGPAYSVVKMIEGTLIKNADEIVVLTAAAGEFIHKRYCPNGRITVIPCGTDLNEFKPASRKYTDFGFSLGKTVVLYNGSLGTFYNLDAVFNFFRFLKRQNSAYFLWIVSSNPQGAMIEKAAGKHSVASSDYRVDTLEHKDIPKAFSCAEISVAFYRRKLSGRGCSPIKVGESLASGIPVIINRGIGDCDVLVADNDIGVVLNDFSEGEYKRAFGRINRFAAEKESTRRRCREAAKKFFSLEEGIAKYQDIYKGLKK